jgi:hypothetical protein
MLDAVSGCCCKLPLFVDVVDCCCMFTLLMLSIVFLSAYNVSYCFSLLFWFLMLATVVDCFCYF